MGMMTIPIVPWSSKMYSSETKSMGFQISQWNRKTNNGTDGNKNVHRKIHHAPLRKRTISELHQKSFLLMKTTCKPTCLLQTKHRRLFVLLDAWEMLLMKKLEAYDKLFNILKLEAEYEYEKEIK
jgi:cobalt-zinc-cadmium efflux system outer membrane protein